MAGWASNPLGLNFSDASGVPSTEMFWNAWICVATGEPPPTAGMFWPEARQQ